MNSRTSSGVDANPSLPGRALRAVIATLVAFTVIVGTWIWQNWGGAETAKLVADVACLLGGGFATACAALAARSARSRVARRGWWSLTAGVSAWMVAALVWIYHETWLMLGMLSSPYLTGTVVFLLFAVGAAVALLLLSTATSGQSRIRLLLDAVIIATSLFVVLWVLVLQRSLRVVDTQAEAVSLAYLIADLVIVALALMAWAGASPAHRPSFALLAVGISVMGLTNFAVTCLASVGADPADDFIELARFVGLVLTGLAGLWSLYESPTGATPARRPFGAGMWLPYLALPVTATVWLGQVVDAIGFALFFAAVILVVAVLARQFIVILENQRLLSDVSRLAFRDPLTGLANRALFLDRLGHAVARHRRERGAVAVLCLDLDNFKTVNDDLGHPSGDELLVRVAGRISESVRSSDTVARLGGDEFALLIEGSVDAALQSAERILHAFDSPIEIDGVALAVRPSIGLTFAAAGSHDVTVDALLRDADLAMYAAKRDGGGCVRTFAPDRALPSESPRAAIADSQIVLSPQATAVERTPPVAVRRPPWVVWVALAALLVGVLAFGASTLMRAPGRNIALDSWLYSSLTLSAAALVAVRSWRTADERWAWALISAGMTCFALGDVVYAVWVPSGQSPSVADALYLALYPFVYAGLLLLMRTRLQCVPAAVRLDAFVVGLTLAAVGAELAAGPMEDATGGSPATVIVGLASPIGDLLLLALATGMLAILGWRTERRWGALVAGFVLFAIADTVYLFETARGTYQEGTWVDTIWPAGALLVAVAAWLPSSVGMPRTLPERRPVTPSAVCTFVDLAVLVLGHNSRLAVLLAVFGLTAVAARYGVVFRDVSALADKHQQAMTDELTGLANRRALATALTAESFDEFEVAQADRAPRGRALLLLDVDQFKEINDSLGLRVGDELLCRIAERLAMAVRPDYLLARAGGDEFAVLLAPGADLVAARAEAGTLIDAMRAPFALDAITVQVEARVSIAMYPDHCAHPEELLSRAEAALADKRSAVGRIKVYDTAVDMRTSHDAWLIEDLGRACEAGELICHYQPKLRASDDRVHSVEALVRWHHPTRGLLMPNQFLSFAEQGGLMRSVTACVLDVALGQLRAWRDHGITLTVAVNLSTTNLLDVDLVDTIDRLLRTHRVPAAALILEITESTLTTDSQRARKTVTALRELGIRLSLDDYGTGWSSLARLQDLSVDELKLDRIFVARLARDPRSIAIVRSTVALAHSLGADLVAEGVEDVDTLRALRHYGCNITQGNVHTPPLPPDQLLEWLTSRSLVNLEVSTGVG